MSSEKRSSLKGQKIKIASGGRSWGNRERETPVPATSLFDLATVRNFSSRARISSMRICEWLAFPSLRSACMTRAMTDWDRSFSVKSAANCQKRANRSEMARMRRNIPDGQPARAFIISQHTTHSTVSDSSGTFHLESPVTQCTSTCSCTTTFWDHNLITRSKCLLRTERQLKTMHVNV